MVALTDFEFDRSDHFFCGAGGRGEGGDRFFWRSGWPIMMRGEGGLSADHVGPAKD